jgi:hypothetical protein
MSGTGPYHEGPSTVKPSRQPPYEPHSRTTALPQAGGRGSPLPAAKRGVLSAWQEEDDKNERSLEYDGDSVDEGYGGLTEEPSERSEFMHSHVRKHTRQNLHQKKAALVTSSDKAEYEDVRSPSRHEVGRHTTVVKQSARRREKEESRHEVNNSVNRNQSKRPSSAKHGMRGAHVNSMHEIKKQVPRHYDMSPFDATVEDYDREWENVLLEATGGVEVGQRAEQRRSSPREIFSGLKGSGDLWGLRDDWGPRATERRYSHVRIPALTNLGQCVQNAKWNVCDHSKRIWLKQSSCVGSAPAAAEAAHSTGCE